MWMLGACGCALHRPPPTPDEQFACAVQKSVELREEALRITRPAPRTTGVILDFMDNALPPPRQDGG
jgi:hypothetical protein